MVGDDDEAVLHNRLPRSQALLVLQVWTGLLAAEVGADGVEPGQRARPREPSEG